MKRSNSETFGQYLNKYLSVYLPGHRGLSVNSIMSYRDTFSLLIAFLKISGIMPIIGHLLGPVMAIFGLPGEASVVLLAAFFAKAAGAAVVSTGRSDYPNQINNVLAFPGIFRGAFDCRAKTINEEMKLAAAEALAGLISDDELSADCIIPKAFDRRVGPAVAAAVAEAARRTGAARK